MLDFQSVDDGLAIPETIINQPTDIFKQMVQIGKFVGTHGATLV